MHTSTTKIILSIIFLGLIIGFYFMPTTDVESVFLTISTFLFTIFTGFFISRQGARYTKIREIVAEFDGEFSAIYRFSGHLGRDYQNDVGDILQKHYRVILDEKTWDYHFTHKSSTLTDLHKKLDIFDADVKLSPAASNAIGRITFSLAGLQKLRKKMVALHQERIDSFQWLLVYFFMFILLFVVAMIPSAGFALGSVLKAAFCVSVISVVVILHNLDNLRLFEGVIGEFSANDVLEIIKGTK